MAANFPLGVSALNHDELTGFDEFNLDEIKEMIGEETSCDPQAVQNVTTGNDPQIPVPAQNNADRKTPPQEKSALGKIVAMYLHDLVYLLIAVTIGLCLCFRMAIVDGHSMYDTLVNGDYLLLINNIFYHNPKPGDIIVASKDSFQDGSPIVKRVIAVEGQTVDIDFTTGTVYVDGVALVEPYIHTPTTNPEGMVFPLVVDEGCIFVMGDNRMNSKDSRDPVIGLIDKREILGKAIVLFLPGTDGGKVERDYSRIGALS